jgi:glucokinase
MILAGDIGGTNARLALYEDNDGHYNLAKLTIFPSQHYSGLDEIVEEFVRTSGLHPAQA